MIKNFLRITLCIVIAVALFWISINSGQLNFDVWSYHIETSLSFALIITFLLFLLLHLLLCLMSRVSQLPLFFSKFYKIQPLQKLDELFLGIYSHNYAKSSKALLALQKHGIPVHLSKLLNLEVLMLQDNVEDIKEAFHQLSIVQETRVIGFEGLISIAVQEGNWLQVVEYSEMLIGSLKSEWLTASLVRGYMNTGNWDGLLQSLQKHQRALMLSKQAHQELIALAKYHIGSRLYLDKDYKTAEIFGEDAYKRLPHFIPNTVLLANIKLIEEQYSDVAKYIKAAWKIRPDILLIDTFVAIKKYYGKNKMYDTAHTLASYHPTHYISHLLLAKTALELGKFHDAFHSLSKAITERTTLRGCLLMIEYCCRIDSSTAEINEWIRKAEVAEIDAQLSQYFWDFSSMSITTTSSKDSILII